MDQPLNLPLARAAIDRDYLSRSVENLFTDLSEKPETRYLLVHRGQVLLEGPVDHAKPALKLISFRGDIQPSFEVFLGKSEVSELGLEVGAAVVLWVVDDQIAANYSPQQWHHLRRTGAGLSALHAGLFVQALALANWHETHQHCPRCGSKTQVIQAGWVRSCEVDGHQIFPRTDPAIIVSIIDDQDRILLGSQGIWEENRWSILAGFVEPGESLNAAVKREMFEEAGLRVTAPKYLGSQSWPFPYSLMLGFSAQVDARFGDQTLAPDGDEIEKLRWFSRAELAVEAQNLLLPSRMSIARAIIEHWYGSEILTATEIGHSGS